MVGSGVIVHLPLVAVAYAEAAAVGEVDVQLLLGTRETLDVAEVERVVGMVVEVAVYLVIVVQPVGKQVGAVDVAVAYVLAVVYLVAGDNGTGGVDIVFEAQFGAAHVERREVVRPQAVVRVERVVVAVDIAL